MVCHSSYGFLSNKCVNVWACSRYGEYPSAIAVAPCVNMPIHELLRNPLAHVLVISLTCSDAVCVTASLSFDSVKETGRCLPN